MPECLRVSAFLIAEKKRLSYLSSSRNTGSIRSAIMVLP